VRAGKGNGSQVKKKTIVVGARGSLLSTVQTAGVIRRLKVRYPGFEFVFRKIITLGDTAKKWQRSDTGIFVKELEEALLSGNIDLAVHSVKDLPSVIPAGLRLAAITKREEPRDVLITRNKNKGLQGLLPGARVGTTSLRRRAQILRARPDIKVEDLRGNLDTRINKLKSGLYDAIIVAAAGLKRLRYKGLSTWLMDEDIMLPAAGQGALGIEIRKGDLLTEKLVKKLEHPETKFCVDAERSFLAHTGAGCRMPVAAFAVVKLKRLSLEGMVISLDGRKISRSSLEGRSEEARIIGRALAETVLRNGGKEILRGIKNGES
jgi:hydroxymethylbilane synthase